MTLIPDDRHSISINKRFDCPLPLEVLNKHGNNVAFIVYYQIKGDGVRCRLRENPKQTLIEHNIINWVYFYWVYFKSIIYFKLAYSELSMSCLSKGMWVELYFLQTFYIPVYSMYWLAFGPASFHDTHIGDWRLQPTHRWGSIQYILKVGEPSLLSEGALLFPVLI